MLMSSERAILILKRAASTDLPFLFSTFSALVNILCCGTQTEVYFPTTLCIFISDERTQQDLNITFSMTDRVQFIMNSLEQ